MLLNESLKEYELKNIMGYEVAENFKYLRWNLYLGNNEVHMGPLIGGGGRRNSGKVFVTSL